MRREHFYRNKKALKRSAAGAALALFLALQITGCSQTADQNKADRKTEQAQGTEKDGLGAEKSSAETEKNGTGTEKPEAAADQGDGVIEFKPGMPIKEGVQAPDLQGSLLTAPALRCPNCRESLLSSISGQPGAVHASRRCRPLSA